MFGYHDVNDCDLDLWSPGRYSALENRAFSGYAKHTQECEDVINAILNGQTSFSLNDDFDQTDLNYIERRLREHGVIVDLSLE